MVGGAIGAAAESIDRRGEDLRTLFIPGAVPNDAAVSRSERVEPARDPLSIALPEDVYLLAGDAARPGYTRDGALSLHEGVLTGRDGAPVLGYPPEAGSGALPGPIRIDRRDVLAGRVSEPGIDSEGRVSYTRAVVDPQTMEPRVERVDAGRLAVARFPAGTRMTRIDATHVRPPSGLTPVVGTPADGVFPAVAPWSRTQGAVDADLAVSRLADGYLAMGALAAAERARSGMLRGAFEIVM